MLFPTKTCKSQAVRRGTMLLRLSTAPGLTLSVVTLRNLNRYRLVWSDNSEVLSNVVVYLYQLTPFAVGVPANLDSFCVLVVVIGLPH